jgi:hypothetical protein
MAEDNSMTNQRLSTRVLHIPIESYLVQQQLSSNIIIGQLW